ncbi:MAG: phage tail protein [Burkholderiales bacterium]|nr:phage tail protein [Burkholderiales bacterium]
MFGGHFAPAGWAMCQGQLMPIAQNDALFALIGTTYGGDGQVTFALPNLSGRVPIGMGTGPGLPSYVIGQALGTEAESLSAQQLPPHAHAQQASTAAVSAAVGPTGAPGAASVNLYGDGAPSVAMAGGLISPAGGGQPHNNMAPSLAVNFIIALFGIFPSRN